MAQLGHRATEPFANSSLAMILNQSLHWFSQNIPQFKLIGCAQFFYHITKTKRNTACKMNRVFPYLIEFAQMRKEKIIQTIFNNILHHIMPAVLCQKNSERSQIAVGRRFFLNVFKDLNPVSHESRIETVTQFFIERVV